MTRDATRRRIFVGYWLPLLLYAAVIGVLSMQPRLEAPLRFRNGDKVVHLVEYAGLGLLLVRALRTVPGLERAVWGSTAAMLIGAGVGACDELIQLAVPGRQASVLDWLADLAGLALAQLLYLRVRRS